MSDLVRIVDDEHVPQPGWDIDFSRDNLCFDWSVADTTIEPQNAGGFKAQNPLKAAILLCLFSDRRRPDGVPGSDDSGDRRGFHGDSFDVDTDAGERELGSLLWTLERSTITSQTLKLAEFYATDALQTLVDQGVASKIQAIAQVNRPAGTLVLHIGVWGPVNEQLYADSFEMRIAGLVTPLSRSNLVSG